MYKHITNGLNKMSVEDFWGDVNNELQQVGLKKKFDKQVKKMKHQEKHQYKDARQVWEYALDKVKNGR